MLNKIVGLSGIPYVNSLTMKSSEVRRVIGLGAMDLIRAISASKMFWSGKESWSWCQTWSTVSNFDSRLTLISGQREDWL